MAFAITHPPKGQPREGPRVEGRRCAWDDPTHTGETLTRPIALAVHSVPL
ncbi:hypothetical protein [Oscillatoria acuminata]|nr:hypothetical protein [Oscillatoria acuminata]